MQFIFIILVLAPILLCYLFHRRNLKLLSSVTSPGRGTRSERRILLKLLKNGVHPKAIFHDVYLKKSNGEYTQVDIVVATPQGLVSIEVKDYSGWLFGNENQRYWTQILNYGQEKHRFYNPIMQNLGHIKALREQTHQFSILPIYNVVIFDGDCALKDIKYHADNTYVGYSSDIVRVMRKIASFDYAEYTDKKEVARILHKGVRNGSDPDIVQKHLESVQEVNMGKPASVYYWYPFHFRFFKFTRNNFR